MSPCCAVPLIAGRPVLTGGDAVTPAVGVDGSAVEPPALVAVTTTSIVWPMSEVWSV